MQINRMDNSTNFTSVIPVKVFYDGYQATNRTNIIRGCNKAINVMCGPLKRTPEFNSAMRQLHNFDPDYSYYRALDGFDKIGNVTCTVHDNKGYIFTGKEASALKNHGKEIGNQKRICNDLGLKNSYEHRSAKKVYGHLVERLINNKSKRIADVYEIDGQIVKSPIAMEIHMTEPMKNKFKLDKILFTQD